MALTHTPTCGGGIPSESAAACAVAGSASPGSPVPLKTRSPATGRSVAMQYNRRWSLALGGATEGANVVTACDGLLQPTPITDRVEVVGILEESRMFAADLRWVGNILCIGLSHHMLVHGLL